MEESWTPHWQDITNVVLPRRGTWKGDQPNKGDKRNQKIFDSHPLWALRVLSSGMMSGLTSPNHRWLALKVRGEEKPRTGPAASWLARLEDQLYDTFSGSNLYRVLPSIYSEIGALGTSVMQVDRHPEKIIHCTQHTIGSYALAQGPDGSIDTLARRVWMTADQVVRRFGNAATEKVRRAVAEKRNDTWVQVCHLIEPNDRSASRTRNKPFASYWWEKDSQENEWLRVSGFDSFPAMATRWETRGESVYGTDCPGMAVLPDVRQLNKMIRVKAEVLEKHIRPPLAAPGGMRGQGVDLTPSAVNYVDQGKVQGAIAPILQTSAPIDELRGDIREIQNSINRGFFADLFVIIASTTGPPQRTATEVASIEAEKLLMLGPVLERVFDELLTPLVDRTIQILQGFDMIDPPPPQLQGRVVDVEFTSALALAQKAAQTVSMERGAGFVGNMAGVNPEVLDVIDFDETTERYLSLIGFPPDAIRVKRDRELIRAERAQAIATQRNLEAGAQAAETARLLSETDVDREGSALQRLTDTQVGLR